MLALYAAIDKKVIALLADGKYRKEMNDQLVSETIATSGRNCAEIQVVSCGSGSAKKVKIDMTRIDANQAAKWVYSTLKWHLEFLVWRMEHGWVKLNGSEKGADMRTNYFRQDIMGRLNAKRTVHQANVP